VAHMGSWELDFATKTILWSDEACRIYGLQPDHNHVSFTTWLSCIYFEDLDFVIKKIKKSRDSMADFSFYHRILYKGEFIRYIYLESKLEFDSTGKPTGLYGITHDVTAIKLAEEQIEFERNNLAALINNTNDLMWSIDKDLKLITCNESFNRVVTLLSGGPLANGGNILSIQFPEKQLPRKAVGSL
jgi:PAS domain-containing protein